MPYLPNILQAYLIFPVCGRPEIDLRDLLLPGVLIPCTSVETGEAGGGCLPGVHQDDCLF